MSRTHLSQPEFCLTNAIIELGAGLLSAETTALLQHPVGTFRYVAEAIEQHKPEAEAKRYKAELYISVSMSCDFYYISLVSGHAFQCTGSGCLCGLVGRRSGETRLRNGV